jgi:hypothetical protein
LKKDATRRIAYLSVFLFLTLVPLGAAGYKLYVLNYPLAGLIPAVSYHVDLSMQMDGHGEDISITTYLPRSDARQIISDEQNSSGLFAMAIQSEGENRIAAWKAENVRGQHSIIYSFQVQASHVRYRIPERLEIPRSYPAEFAEYLAATEGIQVNDPLIEQELRRIIPERNPTLLSALTRIHRHLQDDFKNKDFSGYTDAVTALKLGEASCNGKSRLFAAMARKLNIPARLVGGLVLKQGTKRVTHQWVEVYVNGHWVPFDAINDRFAEIPSNFLTLYYGDLVLFKHTANVNFQYFYKMLRRLVPRREAMEALSSSPLNIFNVYRIFERVGISQNLLKIILMLPLGALVTVIFRNVVGVETFGTFLPALIAAAARETGLLWGVVAFTFIIILSSGVRKALDWMQLLHSPKMAVMLTTVVITMLTMTVLSVQFGLFELAHVTLFPIAILAITAERFALIETEQGFRAAVKILLVTIMVVSACYAVMDSLFLQSMVLAFPELLLVVIALNLWLGKWMGMRMLEFVRFRRLIFGAPK